MTNHATAEAVAGRMAWAVAAVLTADTVLHAVADCGAPDDLPPDVAAAMRAAVQLSRLVQEHASGIITDCRVQTARAAADWA